MVASVLCRPLSPATNNNVICMNRTFSFCPLALSVLLFSALLISFVPVAHAQIPTPLQLDQLKRLSAEQREALLKALSDQGVSTTATVAPQSEPAVEEDEETEQGSDSLVQGSRFGPNHSLIIELQLDDDGIVILGSIRNALGKNLYELNDRGEVLIPGLAPILLAGLTEQQAQLRLEAEPALRELDIRVDLLPLAPLGSTALEPYGYDLFVQTRSFENSGKNLPVPSGYTVGPGDILTLFTYGQQSSSYRLEVGRDGQINLPEIGPVAVAGMTYQQVRTEVGQRLEERYIGVTTSLTLTELRSIQVFVLGDVRRPGAYTLSSLATMTNALMRSGGIARNGSLRKVQLKRNDRLISELDLYDLLLKGNNRRDRRLVSGDVVYVPPVGDQVSVFGQVNRPAIYELKDESTLESVLNLAGGMLPSAYQQNVEIERFSNGAKSVVVANLTQTRAFGIRAGDQINVQGALSEVRDGVQVKGNVQREIVAQWRPGMRLLDILPDASVFELQTDQNYLLVRREDVEFGRISLLSANWRAATNDPLSDQNITLNKGDTVYVFSLSADRSLRITPLLAEIESQASYQFPAKTVSVQGRVRAPGSYPYQSGMRVSDLITAAGSTLDNAYLEQVEITRINRDGSDRSTAHLATSIYGLVHGSEADLLLDPDDVLTIKEIPLSREQLSVQVVGEIKFPGAYSARRGERLSEVIRRAGGLTSMAFLNGSVFLREDLKERESEQLQKLVDRVRTEMLSISSTQPETRSNAEKLLAELEGTKPLGRLVIDLSQVLAGDPDHDVILKDGDKLVVPPKSQEVTVIGEVQYPTSHVYQKSQNQFMYIEKSGGLTSNADRRRIYVIRADGQVVAHSPNRWFSSSSGVIQTRPGDTIVVPIEADRIGKLELWRSVSQIVYNIGVAAAAVAAF